ncbi:MAG: peptide chain release factor-like protein [Kiritimatiellia bacterium]|nr:peptide chain release factor-like protein [Kiritimatiellia bacterium]
MPLFGISPEKEADLRRRLDALGVAESDLRERFIRGGGPGGQKINKTSSTVCLRHGPSGLEVRIGSARSQAMNRFLARRELCERMEEKQRGEAGARQQAHERIRRQKRRRSRKQKARMLEDKRKQSTKKRERSGPIRED